MNLQILENKEFGKIRVYLQSGETLFIAKDVCEVLGISKHRDALLRLKDYHKGCRPLRVDVRSENGVTQKREMSTVNEAGLYQLIFRSDKPIAEEFQKFVTTEVLPSIRRHGMYISRHGHPKPRISEEYQKMLSTLRAHIKPGDYPTIVELTGRSKHTIHAVLYGRIRNEKVISAALRIAELNKKEGLLHNWYSQKMRDRANKLRTYPTKNQ